jgi:hypothetical protein
MPEWLVVTVRFLTPPVLTSIGLMLWLQPEWRAKLAMAAESMWLLGARRSADAVNFAWRMSRPLRVWS